MRYGQSIERPARQEGRLEQQIIDIQREERASAIAQVKALMAQHGLTLADLGPRPLPQHPRAAAGARCRPSTATPPPGPDLVRPRVASPRG
jgi:DNA-binding protein H-NS